MTVSRFVPLKRVARVRYGLGQPPELADQGIPILRATNIYRGKIVREGLIFTTLDRLPLERAPLLQEGEVLVVRSGAYTGDSALITSDWAGAAPGYDLRVSPIAIEPSFLAYTLLGRRALDHIDIAKSRAAQPHLNAEELGELPVWAAPVSTQRATVRFLDAETMRIDALIEKKRRMRSLLAQRRQALIDLIVLGGSSATVSPHPRFPWLRGLPTGWSVRSLRHLATDAGALFTDGDWIESPYITDSGIRLIQTGNVGIGRYREQGFRYVSEETFRALRCTEVLPDDVLICRLADPVGRACLAPDLGERMITSVDVCITRPDHGVDRRFLVYYLSSSIYLSLLEAMARGGTRERVSREQLGAVPVPVPPASEQRAIADELDEAASSLERVSALLDMQVAMLDERRRALITAAVTGELDLGTAA